MEARRVATHLIKPFFILRFVSCPYIDYEKRNIAAMSDQNDPRDPNGGSGGQAPGGPNPMIKTLDVGWDLYGIT